MVFLLGAFSGWATYSMVYIAMSDYGRVYFTEYFSGLKMELMLLLVPAVLSAMAGTEAVLFFGVGMSVALSMTELVYANVHRRFPSKRRKNVYWFKNKHDLSIRQAINECKDWENKRG